MGASDDSSGPRSWTEAIEETLRSISFSLLRFTGFAGNAFLFGFPVFALLVLRPSIAAMPGESGRLSARAAGARAEELVRAALITSVVAVALTILLQAALVADLRGSKLGEASFSSVLSTSFGTWSAIRIPVLVGLAVLLVGRVRTAIAGEHGKIWWSTWLALSAASLLTTSAAGHAGVVAPPGSLLNDVVHLGSGSMWFAGVVALAVILPVAAGRPGEASLVAAAVMRFSRVAFASIAVAAITGTVNSLLEVGHLRDLWGSGYGRTLSFKVLLFLGILALGAVNHFVIRHRLAEVGAASGSGETVGARTLFRKTIAFEVVIAFSLLALTALLTGLAPTADRARAEGGGAGTVTKRTYASTSTYFLQESLAPSDYIG